MSPVVPESRPWRLGRSSGRVPMPGSGDVPTRAARLKTLSGASRPKLLPSPSSRLLRPRWMSSPPGRQVLGQNQVQERCGFRQGRCLRGRRQGRVSCFRNRCPRQGRDPCFRDRRRRQGQDPCRDRRRLHRPSRPPPVPESPARGRAPPRPAKIICASSRYPQLTLRTSLALTGNAAKLWEFRDKLARGWRKTPSFCRGEMPVNGAWAGRLVFAKALPAIGIMAIGGWPKGLFTHQIRQFRVISAATQKCCSREMDR